MLTKERIIQECQNIASEKWKLGWSSSDVFEGAKAGAKWANEQNAARIAELEAQNAELTLLLQEVVFTAPMGSQYPNWIDTIVKIRKTIEKYDQAK